jgi:uroporphyrinogen III methyltransferase / synthase
MMNERQGIVYLVGAGPGSPDLITVKGLRSIREADVLVYDRLVSPHLLKEAKAEAELIYVGKMPDRHTLEQEEINRLLVEKAKQGKMVTRLKGGDPFVFGRGGEEALALAESGIAFEIVPGITSAVAVPAYAGIPVTHRAVAADFTVVTGHEDPTKENSDLDWPTLARTRGTLVILMGMGNLPIITEKLIHEGMDPHLPVALVHRGTEAAQRTLTGTLTNIAEKATAENFKHPAVIVIGKVVKFHEHLRWYENKPLFGRRILVTRAREQASVFAEKLESRGAETIEFPVIKIVPPADYDDIDRAIKHLSQYHWVIFTSENGVKNFYNRLLKKGGDIRDLKGAKICAIGPKTREALIAKGLQVDYMPSEYRAEAIIEQLKDKIKRGDKVLLPRADIARPVLPETIKKLGADVDNVIAYRTICSDDDVNLLVEMLENKIIDIITFTSSSTVKNLVKMLGKERVPHLLSGICLASIGPITSKTASDLGLSVALEASSYTIDGLVEAIVIYSEENESRGKTVD